MSGIGDAATYSLDRYGKVSSEVMRCPVISMQAKALYAVLATYVGSRGDGHCWPTLATLTSDTGMSKPMLIRYLKELETAKVIEKLGHENNREIRLTGKVDLTAIANRPKEKKKPVSGKAELTGKTSLTGTGKAHLTDNRVITESNNNLPTSTAREVEGQRSEVGGREVPKIEHLHRHPTKAEVIAYGVDVVGCPENTAKKFYNKFAPQKWRDKYDKPILDWQARLETWWIDDQEKAAKESKQVTTNGQRQQQDATGIRKAGGRVNPTVSDLDDMRADDEELLRQLQVARGLEAEAGAATGYRLDAGTDSSIPIAVDSRRVH